MEATRFVVGAIVENHNTLGYILENEKDPQQKIWKPKREVDRSFMFYPGGPMVYLDKNMNIMPRPK